MPDRTGPTATPIEQRLLDVARLALTIVALSVHFGLGGPEFLRRTGLPGFGPAEVAVFTALAVVGLVCAWSRLGHRPLPPLALGIGVTVLVGCSATMSTVLPPEGAVRAAHWSFGLVGWYGVALLFDVPLGGVAAFLGLHVVVTAAPVFVAGGSVEGKAWMGVVIVSVTGFQFGLAMIAGLVRIIARAAAETASADEELRVREAAAVVGSREHERRYAGLRQTTVPLLEGLAAGELDPRSPTVRRRCAVEAAKMRRLFAETDDVVDNLTHELGACIDIAERHGVVVNLSVRGRSWHVPEPVRHELLTPIAELLVTSRAPARVTVLWTENQVRVSAACPAPELPLTPARTTHTSRTETVLEDRLWLEVSWRSR